MCAHSAPQRALGGDAHRVWRHLQAGQAELLKMAHPSSFVGQPPLLVRGQSMNKRSGQGMLTHIVQGRVVDRKVSVTGAQQVEEVQTTLAVRRAEPSECVVADLRADRVGAAMARAGVSEVARDLRGSTLIQSAVCSPARSTSRVSVRKSSCWPMSRRMTWRLEMLTPIACSSVTKRSTVTGP